MGSGIVNDMNFDEIHQRDSDMMDGHAQVALQAERQERALDALMWAKRSGTPLQYLETLATELGLRREWQRYQSETQP